MVIYTNGRHAKNQFHDIYLKQGHFKFLREGVIGYEYTGLGN